MRYSAKNISIVNFRVYSLLILLMIMLAIPLAARANVYVIRDKQGNIIRVASQHQLPQEEQSIGCTITILIENQQEKKEYQQQISEQVMASTPAIRIEDQTVLANIPVQPVPRSKFKYTFKEKIDWIKVQTAAYFIEQHLKIGKGHEISYPVYQVLATAYTPDSRCCAPYDDGFTATGYPAGYGSIAIDPDYGQFRYGDVLYVEGYGLGVADDCGSAIKGKHIDVCFNLGELAKADHWGRKQVRVWKIN